MTTNRFAAAKPFALLTVVVLIAALPAAADNLIINGSFDRDLYAWGHGFQGGRETWNPEDAFGSRASGSAQLTWIRPAQPFVSGAADLDQIVPVTAGKSYAWQVNVKNISAASGNYAMTAAWCSDLDCRTLISSDSLGLLATESPSNPQWRTYAGSITAPPNAVAVAVHLRVEGNGTALFDNVSFGPPSCLTCSATVPSEVVFGQTVSLTANVQSTCSPSGFTGQWDFGDATPPSSQTTTQHTYAAPGTYRWTWTATASTGNSCFVTGVVTILTPLHIASFYAAPSQIAKGQSATLSWVAEGASSVLIDNGIGMQPASGSVTVSPDTTTTYTLIAFQDGTLARATVTVEVITTPLVGVASLPRPIVQTVNAGGGATSLSLINAGGAEASLNMLLSGSFFPAGTLRPQVVVPARGATAVAITANPSPQGAFHGTLNLTGDGVPAGALAVPVSLLSAAPVTGNTSINPATARVDVTSTSGSVNVTNAGSATLNAIAWSDTPWLLPQNDAVVIAPGATVPVSFTIDRSKRPDAPSSGGSAEGALWLFTLTGGTQIANVIDTVPATVTTGGLPAIPGGEIELLVPGIGHINNFATDITLFNPLGAVEDTRLYFASTANDAKAATIPATPAGMPLHVDDVVKSIFGVTEQLGTLHIRAKNAAQLIASATMRSVSASGAIGSTVPMFRSDRGAAPNETIVLSGLTTGDLFVQEAAGYNATMQVDFYRADGTKITDLTQASQGLSAFAFGQLTIPAGAASAFITNTSTFPARLVAYARLTDSVSGDTWISIDWSRYLEYSPSEPVVIPVVGNVIGADNKRYTSSISITNRGSSSATGTLRFFGRSANSVTRQVSLGAAQTETVTGMPPRDDLGYVSFTPVTGSFSIASVTYASGPYAAVPVVAASTAISGGQSLVIAPLSDADRRNSPANRPGTLRTNLGFVETTGRPVTVRVTLRYPLIGGARDSRSRDFALGPNQFFLFNSIADQILGTMRRNFADLRDVEADFQIVGGDGAAIVFTSSVDNASGDSIIRVR